MIQSHLRYLQFLPCAAAARLGFQYDVDGKDKDCKNDQAAGFFHWNFKCLNIITYHLIDYIFSRHGIIQGRWSRRDSIATLIGRGLYRGWPENDLIDILECFFRAGFAMQVIVILIIQQSTTTSVRTSGWFKFRFSFAYCYLSYFETISPSTTRHNKRRWTTTTQFAPHEETVRLREAVNIHLATTNVNLTLDPWTPFPPPLMSSHGKLNRPWYLEWQ